MVTVAALQNLLTHLVANGDVSPDTPLAVSSDPEGNELRPVAAFDVLPLTGPTPSGVLDYATSGSPYLLLSPA